MEEIFSDIKTRFSRATVLIQLIYINIGVFLVVAIWHALVWLLQLKGVLDWSQWLVLSSNDLLERPWTVFTYMFMHEGPWHLLFNMVCLYSFGALFLQYFSAKHLRMLYLLGGLAGALVFLLSVYFFPLFQQVDGGSVLLGASASVVAIITAVAVYAPNQPLSLLFLGSIRIKFVAMWVIVLSVVAVRGENVGGEMAHLGGALAGFLFAWGMKRPPKVIKSTQRKPPKMGFYSKKDPAEWQYNARRQQKSAEVDAILDKLKRSGYESLSEAEKKSLFDASKR
ncbi:MAG: rhomboid family intramembrane serine protease [Bacteroidaceae bacterium]|nr:rhomboid family intramembrane serine protease [Bacteroidaceae bacterium]